MLFNVFFVPPRQGRRPSEVSSDSVDVDDGPYTPSTQPQGSIHDYRYLVLGASDTTPVEMANDRCK